MDFNTFKFDDFKSKVTKSAIAAADVVQQLHNMDEMAEEDEYLKTEGLNVKERARPTSNEIKVVEAERVEAERVGAERVGAERETPVKSSSMAPDEDDTTSTPFISPEARAQELIAQALYQTPISSVAISQTSSSASRQDSASTSLADYASAEEECLENTALSEDVNAKNWSLLDSVLSTDPTASDPGEQGNVSDPPLASAPEPQRYNNGIGRNMDQEVNQEVTAQKKQNEKKPYMLSVVAALMEDQDADGTGKELPVDRAGGAAARCADAFDDRVRTEKDSVDANDEPKVFEQSLSLKSAGLHYDSDSSSDDSGNWGSAQRETDPILTMMQKERESKSGRESPQPEQVKGVQTLPEKSEMLTEEVPARKDPHRFFSDLDRRLAITGDVSQEQISEKHDEEAGPAGSDHGALQPAKPETFVEATDKFQWLRTVAAPRILDSVSTGLKLIEAHGKSSSAASITGSRKQQHDGARGTTQDEFNVVVSSSLLAAEEHAELERLKQSTNQNLFTTLQGLVNSNPRFAFIAFTMLLSSFVYFYSRKRTEDDVTR